MCRGNAAAVVADSSRNLQASNSCSRRASTNCAYRLNHQALGQIQHDGARAAAIGAKAVVPRMSGYGTATSGAKRPFGKRIMSVKCRYCEVRDHPTWSLTSPNAKRISGSKNGETNNGLKNLVGPHAITSRRRLVASALMYGVHWRSLQLPASSNDERARTRILASELHQ